MTDWVAGVPASPEAAIAAAAALLTGSRSAVVAGLGTDIAGARASVVLARAIGGCIDHMEAASVFANLDVMRRSGWIVTTPLQLRARADTVLLVGGGLTETLGVPALGGGARPVFRLGASPGPLAALRAIVAGRRTSLDEAAAAPLRDLAAALAEARFGVAVWSAGELEPLAIEMLCGLIDDLNKKTRFAGLPLASPNGAEGVTQAVAWTSGFPVRTGFAGSEPLHDPWRFDAQRLIARGEVDAAVWISSFARTPPPWGNAVPTIVLAGPGTVFDAPPAVVFEVGCPGLDHDAMLYDPALGGIAFAAAREPSAIPTVAETLAAITAGLQPC
jgi:formylmethanofuran dehydrogenase subunit B